jgi:hypothetical protein
MLEFILQEDVDTSTTQRRTLKKPDFIISFRNSSTKNTVEATAVNTIQSTPSNGVVLSRLPNSIPINGIGNVAKCTKRKRREPEASIA